MTIDFTSPCETKALIRSLQGTLYPCKIPRQHAQLKNHIGVKEPNLIYYASQYEIFALNVSTRKRRLIKSLPFKPCCLDAGHGWICAGGEEHGQCAFISINEDGLPGTGSLQHAEVDDLLPLDLDPEYRRPFHTPRRSPQWARSPSASFPKYDLQTLEFGGSITNSVTISPLLSEWKDLKDEIVAVVTNNDHTVRVFSLTQCRTLETLDFPVQMNHASISPCGNLLLAVGDEARAFFCKRVQLPSATLDGEQCYARYRWQEIADPKLSLANQEADACFTTAFSPSGHVCAVATQSGVIIIFDTALIDRDMDTDEAVITVLKSSRAALCPSWVGAVRSMSFSPGPWDLIAWAEDQGRVCVVDLRNAFSSRQVIDLKTTPPDMSRAIVEEHNSTSEQRQLEIERRFIERHREALEAQDHLAAVSNTAEYLEVAAARRRIEREALDVIARENPHSLTEDERQMVDSIGLRRVPGNNSSILPEFAPISVNYTQDWSGLPSPTPTSHVPSRSTASIHEFMRQRNFERSRANELTYQPRRRSSVIISNSSNTSNNSSPHPAPGLAPIGTATRTLSASPSRLPSSTSDIATLDPSDPWQTISDAMGSSNMPPDTIAHLRGLQSRNLERRMQATGTSQTSTSRHTQALQRASEQNLTAHPDVVEARISGARDANARSLRQMRASRADEDPDREALLRRLNEPRPRRVREDDGPTTMGIGWSEEGRHLFVAIEEAILEYPVNIDARKQFPGVSFL